MADLALRGWWQRRMTHAQMREMMRQMKLAQRKLSGMQWTIQMTELSDDIAAENLLEQLQQSDSSSL
jgi:hypothetical protein